MWNMVWWKLDRLQQLTFLSNRHGYLPGHLTLTEASCSAFSSWSSCFLGGITYMGKVLPEHCRRGSVSNGEHINSTNVSSRSPVSDDNTAVICRRPLEHKARVLGVTILWNVRLCKTYVSVHITQNNFLWLKRRQIAAMPCHK